MSLEIIKAKFGSVGDFLESVLLLIEAEGVVVKLFFVTLHVNKKILGL